MKFLEKLQNLLPIGYLYLIILGLIKESMLFNKLGINILKYSSITDILISPIADITSKLGIFISIVTFIFILFLLMLLIIKNSHKKWIQKIVTMRDQEVQISKSEVTKKIYKFFLILVAFELFSIFIGLGLGQGNRVAAAIKNNKVQYNYQINFNDDKKEDIYLIDVNSSYYFYVSKGDKRIKIAPLGSVKNLVLISKENL